MTEYKPTTQCHVCYNPICSHGNDGWGLDVHRVHADGTSYVYQTIGLCYRCYSMLIDGVLEDAASIARDSGYKAPEAERCR